MRFFAIFSLFLVTAFPMAHSEEGLFGAKDTRVPGTIEIAGESVLQMVLLAPNTQMITQSNYDNYLRTNPGENFTLHLAIERVRKCKERSQPVCDIPYKSYGSTFLTDNGQTLWTARHVIESQLGGTLLFALYNSDGEKVFDTSDSKDRASIIMVGNGELIQKRHANQYVVSDSLKQLSSDYIKLQLNHSLPIRPLRVARSKPRINDRVYAIGYANMLLRGLTANSNIKKRSRVAIGKVTNYMEPLPNESPEQKHQRLALEDFGSAHLLVMNLDGLPGQSGSPVLNESGEVVGIFCAGNASINNHGGLQGLGPHFEGIAKNGH